MAHPENDPQSLSSLETASAGALAAKDLVGRFSTRIEGEEFVSQAGNVWRDGKFVPEEILKGLGSRENVGRE